MDLSEYITVNEYKQLLYIFIILFFISNITNGFVTLLLSVCILVYNIWPRITPNRVSISTLCLYSIISLFLAFIISWSMLAGSGGRQGYKIKTKLLATKRPAYFGYFVILCLFLILIMEDNIRDELIYRDERKEQILILFFILSGFSLITRINLLVNTYDCDNIKEKDLVQSFDCEEIKINKITE